MLIDIMITFINVEVTFMVKKIVIKSKKSGIPTCHLPVHLHPYTIKRDKKKITSGLVLDSRTTVDEQLDCLFFAGAFESSFEALTGCGGSLLYTT